MSDQSTAIAYAADQQEKPLQKEAVQPSFLTVEDARKLEERLARRFQGLTDKADNIATERIRRAMKSLTETLEVQRAAGMSITPEQEQALRQRVVTNILGDEPTPSSPPLPRAGTTVPQTRQTSGAGDQTDPEIERVNSQAFGLYREYGFTVDTDDAEAAELDMSSGDAFLTSLRAGLDKKAERIFSKHQARQQPTRTPTLAGSTGNAPKEDLMAQYRKEVDSAVGNQHRILEVRRKYRNLGLPL